MILFRKYTDIFNWFLFMSKEKAAECRKTVLNCFMYKCMV